MLIILDVVSSNSGKYTGCRQEAVDPGLASKLRCKKSMLAFIWTHTASEI